MPLVSRISDRYAAFHVLALWDDAPEQSEERERCMIGSSSPLMLVPSVTMATSMPVILKPLYVVPLKLMDHRVNLWVLKCRKRLGMRH